MVYEGQFFDIQKYIDSEVDSIHHVLIYNTNA